MSSSAQSARCRDMGALHRHCLPQGDPQDCMYDLNQQQIQFCRCSLFCKRGILGVFQVARISSCTSKKRFTCGPHDVDCDSLHAATVLSVTVAFLIWGPCDIRTCHTDTFFLKRQQGKSFLTEPSKFPYRTKFSYPCTLYLYL